VAAHLEVILRATAIFVADVAFANVARKYDDFLRSMENACLTMTHGTRYRSSRDAASLFPSRGRPIAVACGIARFPYFICSDDQHGRGGGAALLEPLHLLLRLALVALRPALAVGEIERSAHPLGQLLCVIHRPEVHEEQMR
jgi:hypothetical protein